MLYKTKNVEFDYNHTSSYGLTDKSLCHCTENSPVWIINLGKL